MNSPEILKKHFSDEEIKTLEAKPDYAETVKQIEQMQADQLLDELEARTTQKIDTALDLSARWEAFKISIQEVNAETDAQSAGSNIPPTTPTEETIEQKTVKAEEALRAKIQKSGTVKGMIGEMVFDWVKDTETSLKDAKGFDKIFGELSLKIGLGVLSMLGFSELYDGFKKEVADISAGVVEVVPNIEVTEEPKSLVKYQAGIGLVLKLSENDDGNTNIRELLLSKKVQESTFSEITSESFSIEDADGDDVSIMKATLVSQEGLIDSILKTTNPSWRELSLLEIFESIGVYAASFADIQNITPETILSGNFNIGNISIGEGFTVGGSLGALFEQQRNTESSPFHNVSEGLLMQLFLENGKKITDTDVERLLALNNFQEKEADKNFQSEFVSFGRGFIDVIISDFYLGPDEHKEAFAQYIKERSLTYNEVLELMILTGGSLEVSSYNDAVKTIIYAKIWKILGEQDVFGHPLRENTYNFAMIQMFTEGVSEGYENVPVELKVLAHNVLNEAVDVITKTLNEAASMGFEVLSSVWNGTDWKTRLGIMAGSGVALYILIQSRWARGATVGLAAGAGAAIVAGLIMMADSAWANPAFREEHPEFETKEELLNGMFSEVTAAGVDVSSAVEDIRAGRTTHDIDRTQIAPVTPTEAGTTTTDVTPSPDVLLERDYPWIYFDGEQLSVDGMTLIPMEGDIVSQEFGPLKIERNRATKEIKFYVNGEERNVYMGNQGGFMDGVADGMLGDGGIFVTNNEGKVFLAVLGTDHYIYIGLEEIANAMIGQQTGEIMISQDFYFYWDLKIEGAPNS